MPIEDYDMHVIHCRMLGHEVNFAYCRKGGSTVTTVGNNLPCRKVLDCWFDKFAVEEFLRRYYTDEDMHRMLAPPAPKLLTLIQLAQQAQQDQLSPPEV